jgi:anthranilate/para-aminobenzoate synthase component I
MKLHIKRCEWKAPTCVFEALFSSKQYTVWLDSQGSSEYAKFSIMGSSEDVFIGEMPPAEFFSIQPDFKVPFSFCGGWVGFRGYDSGGAWLRLSTFVVFDHQRSEVYICSFSSDQLIELETQFNSIGNSACQPDYAFPEFDLDAISQAACVPKPEYLSQISQAKKWICEGQSYEICLSNRWEFKGEFNPYLCYLKLRASNPAAFGAFIHLPHHAVLSSSPELFFNLNPEGQLLCEPIKGTLQKGGEPTDQELQKLKAELAMITDLVANDLTKVCRLHSVNVTHLHKRTLLETLQHYSSVIVGQLRKELNAFDVMQALFPGGSITGAPKARTMGFIQELENRCRGAFTGAIGYVGFSGVSQFSIAIRTLEIHKGTDLSFGAGGAIVFDSDPEAEYTETLMKAYPLWRII